MITVTLSALGLGKLNKTMDRLSRKAEKLGIEKPTITINGSEMVKDEADGSYIEMFSVSVEQNKDIIINGWQFAATLDNSMNGGTIVRVNPSWTVSLPQHYYNTDTHCDHCNTVRRRNDVYVVYNPETQEYKQIGSACLKDFLGHQNAEQIAAYLDGFDSLVEETTEQDCYAGHERHYAIDVYLAHVVAVVQKFGYVNSKTAEEQCKPSTKKAALNNYIEAQQRHTNKSYIPVSEDHQRQAAVALAWAKEYYISMPTIKQSEYDHNMSVLMQESYVTERQLGYVASVIPGYDRSIEKEIAKKNTAASEFIGTVGDTITITATVARILEFDSFYGMTYVHIFNASGNIFVWKTNKKVAQVEQKQKQIVTIKGTIKNHKMYNDVKQTELTRCKIV